MAEKRRYDSDFREYTRQNDFPATIGMLGILTSCDIPSTSGHCQHCLGSGSLGFTGRGKNKQKIPCPKCKGRGR